MSIVGAKTGLNAPIGIALAQNGDLWVANSGSNTVAEFAAGAHGNVAPIRTIEGSRTLLANLVGLAVNPDGSRVWVSEEREQKAKVPPSLEEFAGTANGNVKPLTQISGSKTHLNDPYGLAVGVSGNDPITDDANITSTRDPQVRARCSRQHSSKGHHGRVHRAERAALARDRRSGRIWVPNSLNDLILRFGPSQQGNIGSSQP